MDEAGDPGEDAEEILLVGDEGFSATVPETSWPILGAPAVVSRKNPPQTWLGTLESFSRATRFTAEWRLKSGKLRHWTGYGDVAVGDAFPVLGPRTQWEATVTEVAPAGRVTISYQIQSGARRTREFFCAQEIGAYFAPQADGSAEIRRLV